MFSSRKSPLVFVDFPGTWKTKPQDGWLVSPKKNVVTVVTCRLSPYVPGFTRSLRPDIPPQKVSRKAASTRKAWRDLCWAGAGLQTWGCNMLGRRGGLAQKFLTLLHWAIPPVRMREARWLFVGKRGMFTFHVTCSRCWCYATQGLGWGEKMYKTTVHRSFLISIITV